MASYSVLAQFTSLQKPCADIPWSPVLGALKSTLTPFSAHRSWGAGVHSSATGRGLSSCLGPCLSPVPGHQGDLGEQAREAGNTHARCTVTGTSSFCDRAEAAEMLCSPPPPSPRATGRHNAAASQGKTEKGTSQLVQNKARVPPTACFGKEGGEGGGKREGILKGPAQQNARQVDSLRPETNTCLDVFVPGGLLMVPPAGFSNLDPGMCPVPIPGRVQASTRR